MALVVAGRPSNLHLPPEALHAEVEGDVYDICTRIAEVSPRLQINLVSRGDHWAYVISEECEDGVLRKLFLTRELDERTLTRCREAMGVDLQERIRRFEVEQDRWEAEQRENELEAMYEKFGREMWHRFEKDGFIDTRPVSYPKAGVSGPKRGAK